MKQQNFSKGRTGEMIAAQYLKEHGFEVVEQNWHTKFGEIDIVALNKKTLVFVEVKLKFGDKFGSPEEMITKAKLSQILMNAEMYMMTHPEFKNYKRRIDGICIVMEGDNVSRLSHYENLSG